MGRAGGSDTSILERWGIAGLNEAISTSLYLLSGVAVWNPRSEASPEPAWMELTLLTVPCLGHGHDCGLPAYSEEPGFVISDTGMSTLYTSCLSFGETLSNT